MGDKTDDIKGRAKEAVGDLTDNDDLKREGKVDRADELRQGQGRRDASTRSATRSRNARSLVQVTEPSGLAGVVRRCFRAGGPLASFRAHTSALRAAGRLEPLGTRRFTRDHLLDVAAELVAIRRPTVG